MLKKVCLGVVAAVALGAPAQADNVVGAQVTAAFTACMAAAQDEASKGDCLGEELDRQKAILKAAFDKRTAELPHYRKDMIKAQKAWETWRDADCEAQAVKSGTSSQATSWLTCMVRITAARAAEMPDYGRW